jgi:hypothetical protein
MSFGDSITRMRTRSSCLASWRVLSFLLLTFFGASVLHAQAAPTQDGPVPTGGPDVARVHLIGNDDILRMHGAGLSDDVLVQTIELQPGHYTAAPDDLIALKQAGLSDRVIAAMQAHGTGLATRSGKALRNTVSPPPLAAGIDEIGVYYKDKNGEWQMLQTERVEFRGSNRLKQALTDGILREDTNGWLDQGKSSLVLPTGVELLIYTPVGTQAEEYDLLRFNEHKNNRDFRVKTGGVFHSQTGAQRNEIVFTPKKIAAQMYTFTIPKDIEKGEYGVLPPGSSNQQGLASAGKIFTFSIRE